MSMGPVVIGLAGEHIACADIILSGYAAFQAAPQGVYDLVMEVNSKLLRVAVKSCGAPSRRPERERFRYCYQFTATRARRKPNLITGEKYDARPYSPDDIDIVAFCALDIRRVAYCHIRECAQSMHIDPPGTIPPAHLRGAVPGRPRKTFETYTLDRALAVHRGEIEPFPFKWRSAR